MRYDEGIYDLARVITHAVVEDSGQPRGAKAQQRYIDNVDAALRTLRMAAGDSFEAANLIADYFNEIITPNE